MALPMTKNLKRLLFYFVYILLVWGSFRFFARLPEVVDELWFKPVIWLTPLIWWRFSFPKKLDFFDGGLLPAILWGLAGGLVYFVILRSFTGAGFVFSINTTGVALATAVVEELVFSGFILGLLVAETKKENVSLGLTALGFALIHLPINLFVFHLPVVALAGAFLLAFFVALINGFLRLRSNNVLSAILAHFIYLVIVLS